MKISAAALSCFLLVRADFVYEDFHSTQGLVLNGDASFFHGEEVGAELTMHGEDLETSFEKVRESDGREDVGSSGVVRIAPSRPHAVGSVWYELATPVLAFETIFSFRLSRFSKECTRHRDLDFSLNIYENCYVNGGDGLAFVLQTNGTEAIGERGGQLGYGGLAPSSLAVEFDAAYNPEHDVLHVDHVEVRGGSTVNSASSEDVLLSRTVALDLADGNEHFAKISYAPEIDSSYFRHFSATRQATKFMKDGGENRRIGLFLVFVDSIRDPVIALPLNLAEVLGLDGDGRAFVGFTAATGSRWQNHDLLSWYVCDRRDCGTNRTQNSPEKTSFLDYHAKRNGWPFKRFYHNPGSGYGGSVQSVASVPDNAPEDTSSFARHASPPDADPIGPPPSSSQDSPLQGGGRGGLALSGAESQIPPNTDF